MSLRGILLLQAGVQACLSETRETSRRSLLSCIGAPKAGSKVTPGRLQACTLPVWRLPGDSCLDSSLEKQDTRVVSQEGISCLEKQERERESPSMSLRVSLPGDSLPGGSLPGVSLLPALGAPIQDACAPGIGATGATAPARGDSRARSEHVTHHCHRDPAATERLSLTPSLPPSLSLSLSLSPPLQVRHDPSGLRADTAAAACPPAVCQVLYCVS
jgi:hypothetical protein